MRTVLVSGASGIVGYGVLRSLRRAGPDLRLLGTTIYADSAAEAFSDVVEIAPRTTDSGYVEWLTGIIAKHDVDLLIPGIEVDLYTWIDHVPEIEAAGAKAVLNRPELVRLCRDKWTFYQRLREGGLPFAIDTDLSQDFDVLASRLGLPFLLKPRVGFAGRGIVRVDSPAAFAPHQAKVGSVLMAQSIVGHDDAEYTTSAFCVGQGARVGSMTLRRKLSSEGFTDRAEVVEAADIDDAVGALCAYFKPEGPTNFQFRRHQGSLKLLEINPRISSATSIRAAFGYNESQMACEWYLDGRVPQPPVVRRGRAVRYVEDYLFDS